MAQASRRLMRWQAGRALRRRLGSRSSAAILRSADERYVSPPSLARTAAGRLNLEMGAYLLALRDALTSFGYEPASTNALLAESLFHVMRRFYRPMDAVALAVHPKNRLARARWRQRVSRQLFFRAPDWLMEELPQADGYGFDVRRCVLAEYMEGRGERQFCQEVVCSQDLLMARARQEALGRKHTIAAGQELCDFRFAAPSSWLPKP